MRIDQLVKTYRLINDPEAPSWSIKFTGIAAAATLAIAAITAIAWSAEMGPDAGSSPAAAQSGERTDYVGTDPLHVLPGVALALDPQEAFRAWQLAHPDATVISKEPVYSAGRHVGYEVRYLP